jgi:pimeloyl-ACP methyl ester carboxylesterase
LVVALQPPRPVLDQLGIQIADILGHHTGSRVATEVEQQFPERVRKLVLAGTLPLTGQQRADFLDYVQLREIGFEYQTVGSMLAFSRKRLRGS